MSHTDHSGVAVRPSPAAAMGSACNLEENHFCISNCTLICSGHCAHRTYATLLRLHLPPGTGHQGAAAAEHPPALVSVPASRPPTSTLLRLRRKHELQHVNGQGAAQAFGKLHPTAHLYCSPTTAAASRSAPPEWAAGSTGPTRR